MKNHVCLLKRTAMVLLAVFAFCLTALTKAQDPANADAMYNGFLNAYLVTVDSTHAYFTVSLTNRSEAFQWNQAYEISGVEDAYNRTKDPTRQALITSLLNRYIQTNFTGRSPASTDLSWDTWNDDSAWAILALARGYLATGNTSFLTYAENVWNMAYNRGYDTTLGGGIWENQNKPSKCTLSTASFVPSGVILYQATGDSSYLTKAEGLYSWNRQYLLDTSDYHVNECVNSNGTISSSTNTYNSGLMINAAAYLYRMTGITSYYNDAAAMANYQISRYTPVMDPDYANNGPFGSDQFFRAVSNLARWNNTWSTYSSWFNTNDSAAWQERRTDYNITHNDISSATPATGDISGMETESPMVYRQVTQIQDIAVPFTFSGTYEILNVGSNLALTISGGSNSNDAAVVQEAYTSGPHELWKFVATSGGYYHIINNASGLALNISGNYTASFQEGAAAIQYTAEAVGGEGNDEWMPVHNSDSTYTFYNLNSEQVLDNHGDSTASGNAYDQWFANGSNAQKFTLISH
jgi:hypothetical protein